MTLAHRSLRLAGAAFAATLGMQDASAAPPKTVSVAELHKLIEGMGMQDAGDGKTYVSVDNQGKDGLTVMFFPYDDGKAVRIYTNLGDLPKEKLAAMPVRKLLAYNNDLHTFFFGLDDSEDGKKSLDLTLRADAAALTPQIVRQDIDQLLIEVDETRDLWDSSKWTDAASASTGGGGGAEPVAAATDSTGSDYGALIAKADAIWTKGPIQIGKAIIAEKKVENYGTEIKASSNVLKRGDTLHLYIEPIAFGYRKAGEDLEFEITSDFLMRSKAGATFVDAKDAAKLKESFPYKYKRVDFTLNLDLGKTLPVGTYEVIATLHDKVTSKDAVAKIEFELQ